MATSMDQIQKHMEVVGADGVHVGTVDHVEGDRIKLIKADSGQGSHRGHHHYVPRGLVATVEGNHVRLSANGDVAILFEEEEGHSKTASRPASDKRLWDWNRIGAGAAAIGAVAAGAALLAKRNRDDEDGFRLRLETDENVRLISSDKVEGTPVVGRNGETLGHIKSFMVDKYSGRVAYAVMTFGGTMGFGSSYFPLPWSLLEYDVEKDGYALDVTKAQMANAPRYEASATPDFTPQYRRSVLLFYRPA